MGGTTNWNVPARSPFEANDKRIKTMFGHVHQIWRDVTGADR